MPLTHEHGLHVNKDREAVQLADTDGDEADDILVVDLPLRRTVSDPSLSSASSEGGSSDMRSVDRLVNPSNVWEKALQRRDHKEHIVHSDDHMLYDTSRESSSGSGVEARHKQGIAAQGREAAGSVGPSIDWPTERSGDRDTGEQDPEADGDGGHVKYKRMCKSKRNQYGKLVQTTMEIIAEDPHSFNLDTYEMPGVFADNVALKSRFLCRMQQFKDECLARSPSAAGSSRKCTLDPPKPEGQTTTSAESSFMRAPHVEPTRQVPPTRPHPLKMSL